jgi:hypothetical protein
MKVKCKRTKRYVQHFRGGSDDSYYVINYMFTTSSGKKFSYIHCHGDLNYSKDHAINHFKTWCRTRTWLKL